MDTPFTNAGSEDDYMFDPSILPLSHAEIAHRYGFANHRCMGHNGYTREGTSEHCREIIHSGLVALATEWLRRVERARQEYRWSPAMQKRLIAPADVLLCPYHQPQFLENAGRFWEIYKIYGGWTPLSAPNLEQFPTQYQYEGTEERLQLEEDFGTPPNSVSRRPCCPGPDHEHSWQHVHRRALPEICPICHCTLLNPDEGLEKLVWCKDGCGNNMHAECFTLWAVSCNERSYDSSDEEDYEDSDEELDEDPYDYRYNERIGAFDEDLSGDLAMHQAPDNPTDNEGEVNNVTCVVCRCQWAINCPCDVEIQPECEESAVRQENEQIIGYFGLREERGTWSHLAQSALEWIFQDGSQLFRLGNLRRRLNWSSR